MVVTHKWLHDHATRNGVGWTNKQLAAIGVTTMTKGWLTRMVGVEISDEAAREFERLGAERRRKAKEEAAERHRWNNDNRRRMIKEVLQGVRHYDDW